MSGDVHVIHEKAVDAASEDDRLWFEAHPGREYRLRDVIPYEFNEKLPPDPPGHTWRTLVRQMKEGARMRQPVGIPVELPNEGAQDEHLAKVFNNVADQQAHKIVEAIREAPDK